MITEKKHSKLGASGAYIWTSCPGSVSLSEKAPPALTSEAADEGTLAHALAEHCIVEGMSPLEFSNKEFMGKEISEEMAHAVNSYVSWVYEKRESTGGRIEVESQFDLSSLHEGMFGTNDVCIIKEGRRLVVGDFKYGFSPVDVRENKQLLYYALGALIKYGNNFEDVELVIIQPRAPHKDGNIRSWVVSKDYVLSWSTQLIEAARLTERKDAPLYRGDWCGWCKAKGICPKQKEAVESSLGVSVVTDIVFPSISSLTDEQVSGIIKNTSQITDFLEEVKRAALHRLQSGEKIEGLKLVNGRSRREWSDISKAEEFLISRLKEDAFEKKLLTVAKAEKLIGKKEVEPMSVTIAGSETVAHASDKRKEVQPLSGELIISKRSIS